jgi:peptidoglycan L-alanyl-D-glutamate endopeptidase CwlK
MDSGRAIWEKVSDKTVSIASSLGFEWGGNWKDTPDNPHFQMTFGQSISKLLDKEKEKD